MLPFNWDGSHDVGRGAWISGVMASRGFPFGCQVVSKLKRKVRVLNERNEIVLELDVDLEWSPARLASAVLRVLYGHIVPARPCVPDSLLPKVMDKLLGTQDEVVDAISTLAWCLQAGDVVQVEGADIPPIWSAFANEMRGVDQTPDQKIG